MKVLVFRSPNDKNYANAIIHALTNLLNKEAQGQIMIEQLSQAGQVMTSKAPEFEPDIHKSTEDLRTQFQDLFSEISRQNTQLSGVMGYFRDFKEETEKLSDWLKQININIKAIKTSLPSSLHDKEKSLKAMVDISQRMTDGKNRVFCIYVIYTDRLL